MQAEFLAPASMPEALSALQQDGAVAVGGGTQVGILLRQGMLEPGRLVWLGRVDGLRTISTTDGWLEIGAGATLSEIAASEAAHLLHPMLAAAATRVGNPRVRAVATLGGHLVHADPRQDLLPVLLALDAAAILRGPAGDREIALRDFFQGPFETALVEGELLVRVRVPDPPAGRRSGYARFTPQSEADYPTVGVAARLDLDGETVRGLVLGLGGVAGRPLLVEPSALIGRPVGPDLFQAAAEAAVAACDPISDQRGSAAYKRAMVRLWAVRALTGLVDSPADQ